MKKLLTILGVLMFLTPMTTYADFYDEFEFSPDIHEYSIMRTFNGTEYEYYNMQWEEVDGVVLSSSCFYNCYAGRQYSIGGIVLPDASHISGSVKQLSDQRFNIYNDWDSEVVGELLQKSHERNVADEVEKLKKQVQVLLDKINNL